MSEVLEPIQIRLARLDFQQLVYRDVAGIPRIDADSAAEQGPRVLFVDVRPGEELTGPLGYVPTSCHVPLARITEVLSLGSGARVVLVSTDGRRAGAAAALLEMAGMTCVAALDGGMLSWRAQGLPTANDPHGIDGRLPADVDARLRPVERPPGPLRLDEVEAHLGDTARIRWVKLAAFLLHGKTACVDGRDSHGVIGTPGGDAGEFLLALAAVEACGRAIDGEELPGLLRSWVDAFGQFYMHSDLAALNRHIAAMRADPRIPESVLPLRTDPPSAWRKFTRRVPASIQPFVQEHLRNPEHVGCGHLKLSMLHGDTYGLRRELAEAFLGAYFSAVWEGLPELRFVVLGGGHQEGGVLLVRIEGEIYPYTRIPLVAPAVAGTQLFVHHPQVTAYQRDAVAHWLVDHPALGLQGRFADVQGCMAQLAERQMGATLGHLAKGLPIFEATFAADRTVSVREIGTV